MRINHNVKSLSYKNIETVKPKETQKTFSSPIKEKESKDTVSLSPAASNLLNDETIGDSNKKIPVKSNYNFLNHGYVDNKGNIYSRGLKRKIGYINNKGEVYRKHSRFPIGRVDDKGKVYNSKYSKIPMGRVNAKGKIYHSNSFLISYGSVKGQNDKILEKSEKAGAALMLISSQLI